MLKFLLSYLMSKHGSKLKLLDSSTCGMNTNLALSPFQHQHWMLIGRATIPLLLVVQICAFMSVN